MKNKEKKKIKRVIFRMYEYLLDVKVERQPRQSSQAS